MGRWRCLVVFVVLVVGVLAAQAEALNPVFNGAFGRDLRGWDKERVPVAWSDRDGDGYVGSGSALVVNNGAPMSGEGLFQCLQGFNLVPGASLNIGARIHLPTGQASTGWAAVGLNWFSDPDCGTSHASSARAEVSTPNSAFEWVSTAVTVPAGAVSAQFVAYVTRIEAGGSLLAYFDDIYVKSTGEMTPRTAIYIPAAAHVFGAEGTAWRTDAVFHNPTSGSVWIEVDLLERNTDNSAPVSFWTLVQPGGTVSYPDIVNTPQFAHDGAVGLRVVPETGTVVVGTRTYNLTPAGTYGQYIPGLPEGQATVYGQKVRLVQLGQSTSAASGYRTNIGLVSAAGIPIQVEIQLYTHAGVLLGTKTAAVPPFAFVQVDRILTEFTTEEVIDGYAIVSTPTPGGRFIPYASVVDNRTGDAICVQPLPI